MSEDDDSAFEDVSGDEDFSSGDNEMDDGDEETKVNGDVAAQLKKNYGLEADSDEDAFDQDFFDLKVTLDLLSYPAS